MVNTPKKLAALIAAGFVIFWIGHRLITRASDSLFGPEYEAKSTYSLGPKNLTVADQGSGATVGFCTSFHIDWKGLGPCSANRVLVLPNQIEDLKITRAGDCFEIQAPGENKLHLNHETKVDRITIHLIFDAEN